MKISQNLERVGDEAVTIARRAIDLNTEPQLKPYVDLPRMATMSLEMLREAITAFVNREPERARAVIPRDQDVDDLNRQLHRELSSYMVERPATITRCLRLMVISKVDRADRGPRDQHRGGSRLSLRGEGHSPRRSEAHMKPKILVVDDEPEALEILGFKLKEAGFVPLFAKDGPAPCRGAR